MSDISFEQLYGDDKNHALSLVLFWANDFLYGFGIPENAGVDVLKAQQMIEDLPLKAKFPAYGGFEQASPFKKAAYFYVLLHTTNPFVTSLSKEHVGDEIGKFKHNVASLVGFSIVKNCLHRATLKKKGGDGKASALVNPIAVSKHFMIDLIEASDGIRPETNFRSFALLFEALAYEANPGVCYAKKF